MFLAAFERMSRGCGRCGFYTSYVSRTRSKAAGFRATRTLVAELDSLSQRLPVDGDGSLFPTHLPVPSAEALRTVTGVLRSAALLFDEIVLPYSHLLDGSSLLALGPDAVGSLLGLQPYERLPIAIAGPRPDIREILREMSLLPGEPLLAPAIWSCASLLAIDPDALARRLATREASGVRNSSVENIPSAIALELQGATGAAAGELRGGFADLAAAWTAWADARSRDRIGFLPMDRSGSLMRRFGVGVPPAPRNASTQAAAWSKLVAVVAASPSRSDVHIATADGSLAVAAQDRLLLRAWWQGSYERVIATAVDASWVRFTSEPADEARALIAAGEGAAWARHDIRISLSGSVVELLADMTPNQYRELFHQLRAQRARWLADPTPTHARDLAYGIASSHSASDRRADLRRTVATVSVSTASAVVGALVGWAAGISAGMLAIALAVIGAIVTGPVSDLLRARRFTRAELDGVIRHPVAR
jgi:hypothetical protein